MWTSRSNFPSANMERWTTGLDAGGVEVGQPDGADSGGAGEGRNREGEDCREEEDANSAASTNPSAYRSPVSTARRLRSSGIKCQTRRTQAQAKSRSFRWLARCCGKCPVRAGHAP